MLGSTRSNIQSDKNEATADDEDDKGVDVRWCHGEFVSGSVRNSAGR